MFLNISKLLLHDFYLKTWENSKILVWLHSTKFEAYLLKHRSNLDPHLILINGFEPSHQVWYENDMKLTSKVRLTLHLIKKSSQPLSRSINTTSRTHNRPTKKGFNIQQAPCPLSIHKQTWTAITGYMRYLEHASDNSSTIPCLGIRDQIIQPLIINDFLQQGGIYKIQ